MNRISAALWMVTTLTVLGAAGAYAADSDVTPPTPIASPTPIAAPTPISAPTPIATPTPISAPTPAAGQGEPLKTMSAEPQKTELKTLPPDATTAPVTDGKTLTVGKDGKPIQGLKSVANGLQPNQDIRKRAANIVAPDFNRTIMFHQDDINKIRMVHKVYLDRVKNMQSPIRQPGTTSKMEDVLSRLGGSTGIARGENVIPPAPIGIYLNSIIFRSVGNATAWINGKKYEVGATGNNIKLVNVTSNSAELEWHVVNYKDADINDWLTTFPSVKDNKDEKLRPSRQDITVDGATSTVHFILRPNQYLDIQGKSIREGKPKPPIPIPGGLKNNFSPLQNLANLPKMDNTNNPLTAKVPVTTADKSVDLPPLVTANTKKAVYQAASDGHYNIIAKINDQTINFRVDTGATYPVISKEDARRLGIDVDNMDYSGEARTASGAVIRSAETSIGRMEFDGVIFNNVKMMVADGPFPQPLLGQSFLNKYALIDHGTLVLTNPADNPDEVPPDNGQGQSPLAQIEAQGKGGAPIDDPSQMPAGANNNPGAGTAPETPLPGTR